MDVVYNCGYRLSCTVRGKTTGKTYAFKKRFVTTVDEQDADAILKMTARDITWCPRDSRLIPPFMKLEDWCAGKEGRYDKKPYKTFDPQQYKKLFSL